MANIRTYWEGKSVFITGASSGIGKAVVQALAPYNIHFGLVSRRLELLQELADDLQETGSTFWLRSCDVRNRTDIESAVNDFWQQRQWIDVVWANSGVSGRTSFYKWSWDDCENVLDTNLKGAIYTIIPALQLMVKQSSGTIIGIGSASSMRAMPKHPIYSLSKIGLHYFLESLSLELPHIQFTIIHPGFVDTPLNSGRPGRVWLMTPEKAARLMIKAVAKRKKVYIYPFRMNLVYRLVRHLPWRLYQWAARKTIRNLRPDE